MADLLQTTDIVPLTDLKDALNVTLDEDDRKLFDKLEAARDFVEGYVGPLDAFESVSAVPDALKEALKMYAGHLYENPEATTPQTLNETPLGFFALIGPYRRWEF